MVGEAPGPFVQRLRLERAANALRQNPKLTLTEVDLNGDPPPSESWPVPARMRGRQAANTR